jgi:RNA polymerase sigma-70 factor, ECF subfamily
MQSPPRSAHGWGGWRGLTEKGGKPAPCVDVFIVVDPAGPAFIPPRPVSLPYFFFPFKHFGGNKIEAGKVIQDKGQRKVNVLEGEDRARFEATILPHLDAAFNLARWLLRNRTDAEDVTQDAVFRAFRAFGTYRSGNARAWLLQIVRNTCFTWLRQNRMAAEFMEFDETTMPQESENPETLALAGSDREQLTRALESLPESFREILVLRELEGCSYKEIAEITSRPIGTVMSALARARAQLRNSLSQPASKEARRAV